MGKSNIKYYLGLLYAIDLSTKNLLKLIKAFIHTKKKYPALQLDEFQKRFLNGEDVIQSVKENKFKPWKNSNDWRVQVEYGPMKFSKLKESIKEGIFPETSRVTRPNEENWIPIKYVEELK